VFLYETGYLHAKTISIDSEICSIGSTNIDIRSISINYEMRDLRVLAGQERRQEGTGVRLEILHEQAALPAERFTVPAEEDVDEQTDPGSEEEHSNQARVAWGRRFSRMMNTVAASAYSESAAVRIVPSWPMILDPRHRQG
jgi:hypothetical protein